MKNVSNLKSNNNTPSPKTPGGISKSLLTPCRRLGLSRNWKKNGPSPFRSPLASSGEVKDEKIETRKRKERLVDEETETAPETSIVTKDSEVDIECSDINKTPSRNVDLPRRKKSKTLLSAINRSQEDISAHTEDISKDAIKEPVKIDHPVKAVVCTPVRTKSKKGKNISPYKQSNVIEIENNSQPSDIKENIRTGHKEIEQEVVCSKERSPNDLTKECIVVIQKKIFKNIDKPENSASQIDSKIMKDKRENSISQTIFDSDSDEVPLCNINKKDKVIDEHEDFINKTNTIKPNKELKSITKDKLKKPKTGKTIVVKAVMEPTPAQTSHDDDDDDFDDKKTILIRKTYGKVKKLQKAKSTGSITQRDIDELKTRIESKKRLLLAKSSTPETAELRCLIKKWQKGCQDALTELLELMKRKLPNQSMDYSEMLKTLRIPESLVGYDSENDCFHTPNDEDLILGQFGQ